MALQGHLVEILSASTGTAMTDEATTTADDTIYQITDSAKRIIDLNTAIVVEDSTVTTTEKYTIDYLNGKITFDSVDAGRAITVTGAYLTPTTVATADEYSFNGVSDVLEKTPFHVNYKEFESGLVTATITLGRFFVTDDLFTDDILNGKYKIIVINVDDTHSIKAYGLLTSTGVDSPVEGLVKESMNYQVTNQIEVA